MAEKIRSTITIGQSKEDAALVVKIKGQLKPEHGSLTTTAVYRMGLRKLVVKTPRA
jgi:hypothetical protein